MIQAPKGTQDFYGAKVYIWQQLEEVIRKLAKDFCIEEIRTPTFEYTELFQRGVGETTDIVQKEMFTFKDRGNRDFALKPEGTAGVARSFIQNGMHSTPQPTKLFYITNAFRAERPQKGRYIELHQFGVEFIGSYNSACDAEVISVGHELLKRLNIKNVVIHINSLGDTESREIYNKTLSEFINKNIDNLCPTCQERAEKNPLRVLDCKSNDCQAVLKDAPIPVDSLNEESKKHFEDVLSLLTDMEIPFEVDNRLVRGLDYYTKTVFEYISPDLGAQSAVGGGGRYDNLMEECGGQKMGACGFGIGMDRLAIILEEQNLLPKYSPTTDVFIGAIGEAGFKKSQSIVYKLRQSGISAESDTLGRSVKAQFKYADKIGAKYSFVIGDNEVETGIAKIKNMSNSEQVEIDFSNIKNIINFLG